MGRARGSRERRGEERRGEERRGEERREVYSEATIPRNMTTTSYCCYLNSF
jgi:hypothetical protein